MTAQDPFLFISHDHRDGSRAEALARLISRTTSGLPSFVASSRLPSIGIPLGSDWFAVIRENIDKVTAAVCLLTPTSFERPWVLYEAGIVHGKNRKVFALCLGISIQRARSSGPFGQFQMCSDSQEDLEWLVKQLAADGNRTTFDDQVAAEVAAFLRDPSITAVRNAEGVKADAIHHVSLAVSDLARSENFYRDVLGLPPIERPQFTYNDKPLNGKWFGLPGGQQLHLVETDSGTWKPRPLKRPIDYRDSHFAIRVQNIEHVEQLLQSGGHRPERFPGSMRYVQLYVYDPDGHTVEINGAPGAEVL